MKASLKTMIASATLSLAASSVRAAPAPIVEPFPSGARVAFFGDSITHGGGGFLRVAAHYRTAFPELDIRFYNVGISGGGFKAADLYFDKWLASLKPTHVVLAFGVNDTPPLRIDPDAAPAAEATRVEGECAAFRAKYEALVDRIEALGAKVIVRAITPYDETERADGAAAPVVGKNDSYRRAAEQIRAVAAERGLPLVDDYSRMSELLAQGEALFRTDRVHPNDYGQWRMAETFLSAQGLQIAPYASREETAAAAGLSTWDDATQRVAGLLSADWLVIRDETLDLDAKLAKARDYIAKNEDNPKANPFVVGIAGKFLRDKPQEAELRATAEREWALR